MKTIIYALTLFAIISLSSCIFGGSCKNYVPQKFQFAEFEGMLRLSNDPFRVGDTLAFELEIPDEIVDVHGNTALLGAGTRIINRITTTTVHLPDSNFFQTDTTIANVFDQHFETQIVTGTEDDDLVYFYKSERVGNMWTIKINYIPKRKGVYEAGLAMRYLNILNLDLNDGDCIDGDGEAFNMKLVWKENEANKVHEFYSDSLVSSQDLFVFVVE